MSNEMRVYVGTYAKYNNGSIEGKWLDLEDYSDKEEFIKACLELHSDEEDPELMFQDWEGIPSDLISECSIDPKAWELMEAYNDHSKEAVDAYVSIFGDWDASGFEERYQGEFSSDTAFADNYIESTGMLDGVDETIARYFNYSAFARDLMFDYSAEDGHYFSNY